MRNATVRMKDIAQQVGVSRSTVSLVLNQREAPGVRIPTRTRERILETAAALGYRRNELARAVVTGRNPVFGFLVPAPEVEVAARLLAGALEEAETRQHTVQVIRLSGADDRPIIERCVELRPVGVMSVYVGGATLEHLHQEMARYHIPVAVLDSSFPQERGLRLLSDDLLGCHQAIDHLVALGHRKIAFIGGPTDSGASVLRAEGYRQAMAAAGLSYPPSYLRYGYWQQEIIDQITRETFTGDHDAPTAVLCADDKTAMVVCRTLRRIGLVVPDAVSVIGFADLATSSWNDPPLTTVAQPFHEIGRAAVTRLLAAAAEQTDEEPGLARPYEERLPTRLIVRESTAPVSST